MPKCGRDATVRQQMTHAYRLRLLRDNEAHGQPAERYLCEEHADVIDPHWIETARATEPVFGRCEWEEVKE